MVQADTRGVLELGFQIRQLNLGDIHYVQPPGRRQSLDQPLSITLVSGLCFLHDLFAQHLVHKATLSLVARGVFGVLLWGRWRFGWRGRTAIRWTLSGFVFLALAYFGSKLVLELVLQRY